MMPTSSREIARDNERNIILAQSSREDPGEIFKGSYHYLFWILWSSAMKNTAILSILRMAFARGRWLFIFSCVIPAKRIKTP